MSLQCARYDEPDRAKCESLVQVSDVTSYVCDGLRLIFTLTVSFKIIRRNGFTPMPLLAKLSLICLIVQALVAESYDLVLIIGGDAYPSFVILSYLIFLENHWFFTAHYVRVAILFRGLFTGHSDSEIL